MSAARQVVPAEWVFTVICHVANCYALLCIGRHKVEHVAERQRGRTAAEALQVDVGAEMSAPRRTRSDLAVTRPLHGRYVAVTGGPRRMDSSTPSDGGPGGSIEAARHAHGESLGGFGFGAKSSSALPRKISSRLSSGCAVRPEESLPLSQHGDDAAGYVRSDCADFVPAAGEEAATRRSSKGTVRFGDRAGGAAREETPAAADIVEIEIPRQLPRAHAAPRAEEGESSARRTGA